MNKKRRVFEIELECDVGANLYAKEAAADILELLKKIDPDAKIRNTGRSSFEDVDFWNEYSEHMGAG